MKRYSYKENSIVEEREFWTGHIDDYFNKCFVFKNINVLYFEVEPDTENIIDLAIDFNYDIIKSIKNKNTKIGMSFDDIKKLCNDVQSKELDKMQNLLSKTFNTIYEFVDTNQNRRFLDVLNCQFKIFEEKDRLIYEELSKEVNEYNRSEETKMLTFLHSINAYDDFVKYHKGRSLMFQEISKTITELGIN